MKFLVPTGIGDSVWALHKVQSIRDARDPGGPIDIRLNCGDGHASNPIESRALDFVRRFPFVSSAEMQSASIHRPGEKWHLPDGCYNYIDDGMYDIDGDPHCVLIPNRSLEHGERLESWLPQYPINWDIFSGFRITPAERELSFALHNRIGPYAAFYPGPLNGNTYNGHNRNALWTPADWIALGQRIHSEFQLPIVTIGASYDAPYYDHLLSPLLNGASNYWTNLIGHTSIGQLYSITSAAKFLISYQAGVGIVSTYLRTPTAIFWRPKGNSISPDIYLSFEESMASAWVPPAILESGAHLPLIYGRHKVDYIIDEIKHRGWVE